ncbi:unnamed protein product, partial [Prorocentrum cordatum]
MLDKASGRCQFTPARPGLPARRRAPSHERVGGAGASREIAAGGPAAQRGDAADTAAGSGADFWRAQLEAIYRRRNPLKLPKVPELLEEHRGREVDLYRRVCRAYDLPPTRLYADPAAWADQDLDMKPDSADVQGTGFVALVASAMRLLKRTRDEAAGRPGAGRALRRRPVRLPAGERKRCLRGPRGERRREARRLRRRVPLRLPGRRGRQRPVEPGPAPGRLVAGGGRGAGLRRRRRRGAGEAEAEGAPALRGPAGRPGAPPLRPPPRPR